MRKHTGPRNAGSAFLFLLLAAGCGSEEKRTRGDGGGSGSDAGAIGCSPEEYRCEGATAIACDPAGTRTDCSAKGQMCIGGIGCSECRPGAKACANGQATFCREDGTLAQYECDPEQGLTCMPSGCFGACDYGEVYQSYIGCDYYPTVTLNPVWSGFGFAVAVSNTASQPANVVITRGANVVQRTTVPGNQLVTFELPWVADLKGGDITCTMPPPAGATRLVDDGAYRVRTDRPVTVYQFSPLEYAKSPAPAQCPTIKANCAMSLVEQCFSYSNDASLLLPATALTGNYTALAWPSQSDGAGFLAITATENGTRVDVSGTGAVVAGAGISSAGSGSVMLDRGDVLEVVSAPSADLSGTRVRATKAVQVLAGHSCAYVPSSDVQNCDHLEEVVFPEDTLGREYFVAPPVYLDGKSTTPHVVRIAAVAPDTHVSFDPKVRDDLTLAAGAFAELKLPLTPGTAPSLHVRGDKPLLITTYMEGQQALGFSPAIHGDPSMSIAVPVAQYRTQYLFTAPVTYDVNIASVVAKRGTMVRVDGRLIAESAFQPIGTSEYGVANVVLELPQGGTGKHEVSASSEVGLTVYGYGQYTSYMYPGGADLQRITDPIQYL